MLCCATAAADTLTFPAETTVIGEYAFQGDVSVTSVQLPQAIQRIEKAAFAGTGIHWVSLPDSLVYIAADAFEDDVIFSLPGDTTSYAYTWAVENNRNIESDPPEGLLFDPDDPGVVTGYTGTAETLMIPASVRGNTIYKIADNAFANNTTLTSVNLPGCLEEIGSDAFYGCSELQEIVIPGSVNTIGSNAFSSCSKLRKAVLPASMTQFTQGLFSNCSQLKEISISIAAQNTSVAFTGCSIQTIHYLKGSTALMPDFTEISSQENRVEYVCRQTLKHIDFENGIKHIGNYAFYESNQKYAIESIGFPSTLETVGAYAFSGLWHLESIVLPEGTIELGEECFSYCGLSSVVFPQSLQRINDRAFYYCSDLITPELPDVILGEEVFAYCLPAQEE